LGLMWVVLFLGDSLKVIQVLGAILVIIGVAWSQRFTPQTKTPEPTKA